MKKNKITKLQQMKLPISSGFWEFEESAKIQPNMDVFNSQYYNTKKLKGNPFYKSISKMFNFK